MLWLVPGHLAGGATHERGFPVVGAADVLADGREPDAVAQRLLATGLGRDALGDVRRIGIRSGVDREDACAVALGVSEAQHARRRRRRTAPAAG